MLCYVAISGSSSVVFQAGVVNTSTSLIYNLGLDRVSFGLNQTINVFGQDGPFLVPRGATLQAFAIYNGSDPSLAYCTITGAMTVFP